MSRRILAALVLATSLACGGGMTEVAPPDPVMKADAGPPDAGAPPMTCGPAALCSRTINECNTNLTQMACEGWYAKPANCLDMPAYTACNCDCITEATCSDYFACGNLCFNANCK